MLDVCMGGNGKRKALNGLVVRFLMTMSEVAKFISHTPYHNERREKGVVVVKKKKEKKGGGDN
jgi:hypothetical protein